MTISSPQNAKLKEIRRLQRRSGRERADGAARFVAEGEDLLAAADEHGWTALERYAAAGSGLPGTQVEPELLAAASALGSGTRTLAVYEQRWAPAPLRPLAIYLHGVHDPGNVGTVLRSAHAFGAACVALGPGCADPYGPKAVRASMGAVFSIALVRVDDLAALPGRTIALDAGAAELLAGPLEGEATILIGAERDGLPPELLGQADETCRIAIRGDSLNAAMAATVALYELTRATR